MAMVAALDGRYEPLKSFLDGLAIFFPVGNWKQGVDGEGGFFDAAGHCSRHAPRAVAARESGANPRRSSFVARRGSFVPHAAPPAAVGILILTQPRKPALCLGPVQQFQIAIGHEHLRRAVDRVVFVRMILIAEPEW